MEQLRAGIIGSGFIADHHAAALRRLPGVEIVGVASVMADQARAMMKAHGIPGEPFTAYKDLLAKDLDMVSVCLPNNLHEPVAIDVLSSGAHALVEKPLARTVAEGTRMVDAEKASGKTIFYCENNMYAPTFTKVKEIVDEGALGKIYMGRGKEQHSGPHSAWFYKKEAARGGALVDLGIHDIACLRWFLGCKVEKVFCQVATTLPDRGPFGTCEVEDTAVGVLYFENGAQVVIEESWCAPGGYDMRFELFGTSGQVKVAPTFSNLVSVYSEQGYGYAVEKASSTRGWTFPVPAEGWNFGYPQEMEHFASCIVAGTKPLTTGAFGLEILNIVEAMYASAASGRVEPVPAVG